MLPTTPAQENLESENLQLTELVNRQKIETVYAQEVLEVASAGQMQLMNAFDGFNEPCFDTSLTSE